MRIRSIKPEFYSSESVGRLSREARLLFVGLWSLSDDHGRFRANPRLIAASLFPYDTDAVKCLPKWIAELEAEGSVGLYTVGSDSYGYIPKWKDHQRIDKPSKSGLPEPTTQNQVSANPREDSSNPRESSCEEGKGREGSGKEGKGEEEAGELHELQLLWNLHVKPPCPRWLKTEKARKSHADARLKDYPAATFWVALFERINASDFLSGRKTDFRASPDWVLKPANLTKIVEGNYDGNGAPKGMAPPVDVAAQVHTTRLVNDF